MGSAVVLTTIAVTHVNITYNNLLVQENEKVIKWGKDYIP
jgi:hypothetical protein